MKEITPELLKQALVLLSEANVGCLCEPDVMLRESICVPCFCRAIAKKQGTLAVERLDAFEELICYTESFIGLNHESRAAQAHEEGRHEFAEALAAWGNNTFESVYGHSW